MKQMSGEKKAAEKLKKFSLFTGSIVYGFLSWWWIIFSILFMFPDTKPGEKEWAEDAAMIPFGWIMAVLWLLVTGGWLLYRRKKRKKILRYIGAVIAGGVIAFGVMAERG